jgi:hypothetical protein
MPACHHHFPRRWYQRRTQRVKDSEDKRHDDLVCDESRREFVYDLVTILAKGSSEL